ncbi:hypothetical protein CYMTET_45543 [Cymbomonas tetramitiformis]|uniref:Uncharacterized protein n=1 Tax=Cymbomonas tetramitiformis TaxID=36881 RepID=A0AAE0BZU1_9CHLO|nr:hypothetical protein CYMTET_45543 [Cymbomonas tetramitiformis]
MALPTASEDIYSNDTEVFQSGVHDQEAASRRSPQVRALTEHRHPWREDTQAAGEERQHCRLFGRAPGQLRPGAPVTGQ